MLGKEYFNYDKCLSIWDEFKRKYIVECNTNMARVKWDKAGYTVSEGIGYGMLMAVCFNDKITFDKLWRFYRYFPDQNGLMHWKVNEDSVAELNAATDADEDCAMALIMADAKWNESVNYNYRAEAEYLISNIKKSEINQFYTVKPGDMWGGEDMLNISYFAPAYYRAFGKFTNDEEFWSKVIERCYEIIELNQTVNMSVGGLVSDWCNSKGRNGGNGRRFHYSYDATRTPWRMATDYLWWNEARAKSYCDKNNKWMRDSNMPANIADGYTLNGKVVSGLRNLVFACTFAMTTVTDDELQESFIKEIEGIGPGNYFDQCMYILFVCLIGNHFKNPILN